jgi:hypothetical protein
VAATEAGTGFGAVTAGEDRAVGAGLAGDPMA